MHGSILGLMGLIFSHCTLKTVISRQEGNKILRTWMNTLGLQFNYCWIIITAAIHVFRLHISWAQTKLQNSLNVPNLQPLATPLLMAIKPVNQFGTTVQVWILSYPYYGDCSTAVDTMCPQFNSTHDLISAHQHSFTATDCCPLANYHTRVSTASGKLLAPR